MNITDLAKEPQLIPVKINDETLVKKYGDELVFYIKDRQPLDVYAKLAVSAEKNSVELAGFVEKLILDEKGEPVVQNNKTLPLDVLMEAMRLISETLGK